jgi:hypothetical protein
MVSSPVGGEAVPCTALRYGGPLFADAVRGSRYAEARVAAAMVAAGWSGGAMKTSSHDAYAIVLLMTAARVWGPTPRLRFSFYLDLSRQG